MLRKKKKKEIMLTVMGSLLFTSYFLVYVYVHRHACYSAHVEVTIQLCRACLSFYFSDWFQGSNSGYHVWRKAILPIPIIFK